MRFLLLLPLCAALSGCYVAISGHQTASGGAITTTTGAATRLDARAGSASIGASFGAPPASHAPGGQVALSRSAAAVLFLGLVVADTGKYLVTRPGSAPDPASCVCQVVQICGMGKG